MTPDDTGPAEPFPFLSVVIPSYQRCDELVRLLDSLDDAIAPSDDVEVVVVIDGSTDGSTEAVRGRRTEFDLRWHWQENAGRSAARNTGVAMARGRVCWLIDDDMTVDRDALRTHIDRHAAAGEPTAIIGPQREQGSDERTRAAFDRRIERLTRAGRITDPFDFWTGSFSAPRETIMDLGGFSEDFSGWGEEDVELGFRIVEAGIPIVFDPRAGGMHWRERTRVARIADERERGRNIVVLVRLHPEAGRRTLPAPRRVAALHRAGIRSPRIYGAVAAVASILLATPGVRSLAVSDLVFRVGIASARLAGLVEAGASDELQRQYLVPEEIAWEAGDARRTEDRVR